MQKFAEWGLLTEENALAVKNYNREYILPEVMRALIEGHPDVVLYQYDFNLIIRHPKIPLVSRAMFADRRPDSQRQSESEV